MIKSVKKKLIYRTIKQIFQLLKKLKISRKIFTTSMSYISLSPLLLEKKTYYWARNYQRSSMSSFNLFFFPAFILILMVGRNWGGPMGYGPWELLKGLLFITFQDYRCYCLNRPTVLATLKLFIRNFVCFFSFKFCEV